MEDLGHPAAVAGGIDVQEGPAARALREASEKLHSPLGRDRAIIVQAHSAHRSCPRSSTSSQEASIRDRSRSRPPMYGSRASTLAASPGRPRESSTQAAKSFL